MKFQLSYFKSWKMNLWKCCTQYASKFGKLSSGHRTGKVQFFLPIPKKGYVKECSNYRTIALISQASKVMLKILQARLQQYMNQELPDIQAGFRKDRGTRDNCQHLLDHQKSKRVPEKHLLLLYFLCQSLWLCGPQQTVENSSRDGNTRHLTCLLRNLYAGQEATVRTGHETMDWFKLGK